MSGEPFVYADDRDETEPCERGTDGCAVDHTRSDRSKGCETW